MRFYSLGILSLSFVLLAFAYLQPAPMHAPTLESQQKNETFNLRAADPSVFTKLLNNRLVEYMDRSVKQGIRPVANTSGLRAAHKAKKLVLVKANSGYILDTFQYSYAFLTPYAATILAEIGRAFEQQIEATPLAGTKLIVTSMTRTHYTVSKLVKRNKTAVRKSPHLNGNSFDFSFSRFQANQELKPEEMRFLQEKIAALLFQFKKDLKIWVTYEANEECLHCVARKGL
ncbi:MAG: hypothetical protein RLZZ301_1271 [Bacteroidota bacterium]|jgi:hypothetical protein